MAAIIVVVVVAALAGGLIFFSQRSGSGGGGKAWTVNDLQYVPNALQDVAGLPQHSTVLGYPDAKATIIEYGDLRCPVCQQFDAQVMPDIITNLVRTHRAAVDLRLWAILGPNSVTAHQYGYAAAQQNKLWPFALVNYYNQGNENKTWFNDSFARAVASAVGVQDMTKFEQDRASAAANTAISSVSQQATAIGATGTPTILVKGPKGTVELTGVPTAWTDLQGALQQVGA
jgi:protein-disulfide isomerase